MKSFGLSRFQHLTERRNSKKNNNSKSKRFSRRGKKKQFNFIEHTEWNWSTGIHWNTIRKVNIPVISCLHAIYFILIGHKKKLSKFKKWIYNSEIKEGNVIHLKIFKGNEFVDRENNNIELIFWNYMRISQINIQLYSLIWYIVYSHTISKCVNYSI